MNRFSRRDFLCVSGSAVAGLWLAGCAPIQAPTPEAQVLKPLPVAEPVEVNRLEAEQNERIEKVVDLEMNSEHVPGMSVGIVRDGEVVYAKGFGVARIGTDQPLTTQSLFQVMDLTHLFTVAAAMQLVEQGKLELDAPIVEYLPYFKMADDRYTQITMRHLLSETARLPATPEANPSQDWQGKTPQTDDGALERYVRSLSETRFAPGTLGAARTGNMCNMGFDIAGDVVAKVSGEIYEEYMHRHILEPLGMHQSTFYPEQVNPDLLVAQHVYQRNDLVASDLITTSRERAPSTGLFSNLADLLLWTQANLNRGELAGQRLLQESSYDEIWKPQDTEGRGYEGLGWFVRGPVYTYWAGDIGFHGACHLALQDNAGAVVLGNLYTSNVRTEWYADVLAGLALRIIAPR